MSKIYGDDAGGHPSPVSAEDDPYAELFADCTTAEDVLQLQREIEEAERS